MNNWDKFKPAEPSANPWTTKEEREKYQADFIAKPDKQYTQLYKQRKAYPTATVTDNETNFNGGRIDAEKMYSSPNANVEFERDGPATALPLFPIKSEWLSSVGIDMAQSGSDKTVYRYLENGVYTHSEISLEDAKANYKTHTHEGGRKLTDKVILYYSCTDCSATLDPNTTRFAELNNHAMNNGWKIRWGHNGYDPFCPTCAEKRGIDD